MKKILLLSLMSAIAAGSFAQKANIIKTQQHMSSATASYMNAHSVAHKNTADGDTLIYFNIPANDTAIAYSYTGTDGAIYGMNTGGFKAYAERYDINGVDSTVTVLGALAWFTGAHTNTSTHTIDIKAWSMGNPVATSDPNVSYSGFPDATLATQSFGFTSIHFDSIGVYLFATPAAGIGNSFFIGYDINYDPATMNGDTINLLASTNGNRTSPPGFVSGSDTILNDVTCAQASDGTWIDNFWDYTSDPTNNVPGILNDYYIAPIMVIKYNPAGVTSITKNNLTFFGNYPNPAVNSTNIKFSLKNAADVTIQVMDVNGRVMHAIVNNNLSSGDHIIPVATTNMAAGNYIYTIRTSDGATMASQMTVIK